MDVGSDQSRFASDPASHGGTAAARSRMRDKVLWVLVPLIVLCVIAYLVADDYYVQHHVSECFPGCTFKQDLSDIVSFFAPILAVLLAIWLAVRWVRLGRRSPR